MSETPVQPYGNAGHQGPGSVPDPERNTNYRWGIRVESDTRGPQLLGTSSSFGGWGDAMRSARHAAEKHRGALRELGIGDKVVPWVQAVTTVRTATFSEPEDLEAYT